MNSVVAKGKNFNSHLKMSIGLKLEQNQTAVINNHRPEIQAYIMYIAKLYFVRSVLCDFGLSIFQYGSGNQLINRYY